MRKIFAAALLTASAQTAHAQQQAPYPPYAAPAPYGYSAPTSQKRTGFEIGALYATAAVYGVGLGVWFGAEADIDDPGLFMIAPAVLGVAGPAVVYLADRPSFPRGVPSAIAAGAVIGAGEGIGIASLQFVTAKKEDAWGFRGLSRATAIGATLGAAGGGVLGYLQQPSPRSTLLMTSSVAWGSAIGAMFGYGGTEAGIGYGRANDGAALGGLIGYNVGLVAAGAVSTFHIPTYSSIGWMWAGAGIGFAASLPVYVFYGRDDGPPAKRGLIFSGTATTLGLLAAGFFTAGDRESASAGSPAFARVLAVAPTVGSRSIGLSVVGDL